jgi:hypothetical protein
MSGIFVFVALAACLGGVYAVEELQAYKRRQALRQTDPLGHRLKEPAYLRKTMPSAPRAR